MTRRVPAPLAILAALATIFALFHAVTAPPADACGPGVEAVRVDGDILCTHGNDEPPAGVDTTELPTTDELLEARFGTDSPAEIPGEEVEGEPLVAPAGTVACIGDGVTGARVQLVYARASNVASRYGDVLPLLRQYASDADDIINVSAGKVGDGRRVRYATNSNCLPEVLNVTLSTTGDDTFGNMVTELRNMGLDSADRKYLVFMDAAVGICGLGEVYLNDRGDELNPNNTGRAMYARVDTSCWKYAAAHEMLHNLGSVQLTAPNSSGAGHCTDEVDVMCYKDTSTTVTRQVCDVAGQVDCNNNDYFHPNPRSGSYLDQKWNVARSRYLATAEAPPLPETTTVTVPSSGYAGIPWGVRADVSTSGATVVWSSTRSECWFKNPKTASTSWTCPATAEGAGEITAHITENGITTPYTTPVALVQPSSKQSISAGARVSDGKIRAGQKVKVRGRVLAMSIAAPIAGLPVVVQGRNNKTSPWSNVATAKTNRNGVVALGAAPTKHRQYRVRSLANHTWATDASNAAAVSVSTKLTTTVNSMMLAGFSDSYVRPNETLVIAGEVSPDKSGRRIVLKRYRNGSWRTISDKTLNTNSRYRFAFTPNRKGKVKLQVVKPADSRNALSRRVIRFTVG